MEFHTNPSAGSHCVSYGRTDGQSDRHDEAKSRFFQLFCVGKELQLNKDKSF